MNPIVSIILLGIAILVAVLGIIGAVRSGEMKNFIVSQVEEAEQTGKTGAEKLKYVIEAVDKKYKIVHLFVNVRGFIEKLIEMSKQVNK